MLNRKNIIGGDSEISINHIIFGSDLAIKTKTCKYVKLRNLLI